MRNTLLALPLVLCVAVCLAAQDQAEDTPQKHWPLGCQEGAVDIQIDRSPAILFRKLSSAPLHNYHDPAYTFEFGDNSPFTEVQIFLATTVALGPKYGPSAAELVVYARTVPGDTGNSPGYTWWELSALPAAETVQSSGNVADVTVDVRGIASCFEAQENPSDGENCTVARVAPATTDPHFPLAHVSFTQDLGGANARNWEDHDLLLDFRTSPPRALLGITCGYNEGGGVCTAQDSAETPRYDLVCNYSTTAQDFLCTETTTGAHRDYYLLTNRETPARNTEQVSLESALKNLRGNTGNSIAMRAQAVRGYGPVNLVDEVVSKRKGKIAILAGSVRKGETIVEAFHFLCESPHCAPITIIPRTLLSKGTSESDEPGPVWTAEANVNFASRRIYEDERLAINEVVANQSGTHSVFWTGVEKRGNKPTFDVLRIASEYMEYSGCGRLGSSETVLAAKLLKPFEASIKFQPAFQQDANGIPAWVSDGIPAWVQDEPRPNCIRKGNIRWITGKGFQVEVAEKHCWQDQPRYIVINDKGVVSLSDRSPTD